MDAARRLGIEQWVRTERADPVALDTWERPRHELIDAYAAHPGMLLSGPTPDAGFRPPPVDIHFAPYREAEALAAHLHARYDSFVSLQLGALPFPLGPDSTPVNDYDLPSRPPEADPDEIVVALDGALAVARGHTVTHGMLLTNTSSHNIGVDTNSHVTAVIIDPRSGDIIGGYNGGQILPLVVFHVRAGKTVRIPLLVGTASYEPRLGYAIPAGTWQLVAPLELSDGRLLASAPLDIAIVD